MPNPVAANDLAPISGSLQTSRISYGIDLKGKNYGQNYNGTKWYSDIPNDGTYYTIVSDNYTANYYISRSLAGGAYVEGGQPAVDEFSAPVFWTTQGTSSADIIAVVNGLPDRKGQTAFTTGEQALNWIASSGNYFAIGPDYFSQIDADGLVLNVDAQQIISYPTTESTWYDLAGYSHDATLINGPTWNSNGWVDFDGSNDYAQVYGSGLSNDVLPSSSYVDRTATFMATIRFDSATGTGAAITRWGNSLGQTWWFGRYGSGQTIHLALDTDTGYKPFYSNTAIGVDTKRFYHIAATVNGSDITFYTNGQEDGTGTYTGNWDVPTRCPVLLGAQNTGSAALLNGQISSAQVYARTLTSEEVAQNYYGGPIITDGLVFHVDASNLLSYNTSIGPIWLDMSNTMQQTDLLNGVTWSPENGGVFLFDGVDDIGRNSDPLFEIPENVTINAWIKESSGGATVGNYMAKANNNGYRMRRNGGASGDPLWIYSSGNSISGGNIYTDVWHMVTGVFSDTGLRAYIDGELIASNSTPYAPANLPSNDMFLGGYQPGSELFGGQMAMAQTYNRALTTQEIQQLYNATK